MSVISNSDGRTNKIFEELGLRIYFDEIFDSEVLGLKKPDPQIFFKALSFLNLTPEQAIYIGDLYEVDIKGANAAQIGGIHIDPLNLYKKWSGIHIADVRSLPQWLNNYAISESKDLFPCANQQHKIQKDSIVNSNNWSFSQ